MKLSDISFLKNIQNIMKNEYLMLEENADVMRKGVLLQYLCPNRDL